MQCSQCGRTAIVLIQDKLPLCLFCYSALQHVINQQLYMLQLEKYNLLAQMEAITGLYGFYTGRMALPSPPPPYFNVQVSDTVAGVINLGTINNLHAAIEFARTEGGDEFAEALRSFAQTVAESSQLQAQAQRELLELISSLAAEVGKPRTQRSTATISSIIDRIAAIVKMSTTLYRIWQDIKPLIDRFLES